MNSNFFLIAADCLRHDMIPVWIIDRCYCSAKTGYLFNFNTVLNAKGRPYIVMLNQYYIDVYMRNFSQKVVLVWSHLSAKTVLVSSLSFQELLQIELAQQL